MKIKFLPFQSHCFAFGGFEIQMLATFDALDALGASVSKMDVWSRDQDFEILHCWGLDIGNYENIKWAKKSGKKVVVTALLGYYETLKEKARFLISSIMYKQRIIIEMLENIDAIVVLNDLQAEVLKKNYNLPDSKIFIIPNIVGEIFFEKRLQSSDNGYVLTVGNVCARKNQILLAKACQALNLPLVIIGKMMSGEEKYGEELEKMVTNSGGLINWINGLKENSDELVDYFLNCKMFALPSHAEQQPISILEASVLGKPILTSDLAFGRQIYYHNSMLVNPSDYNSILNGLKLITYFKGEANIPSFDKVRECSSQYVADSYLNVYNSVIQL
ncbi:glycosyltransferase family 4 protein [Pedobacter sp. KACC 23697]|uniref:Glycosyltransferase family 4 protein n=1 Tax=Pedobacter sp. KACC 23697 TaxID=3149230 RepID=A0AAU7K2J7_9SPHI